MFLIVLTVPFNFKQATSPYLDEVWKFTPALKMLEFTVSHLFVLLYFHLSIMDSVTLYHGNIAGL